MAVHRFAAASIAVFVVVAPASAEVRFGRNVFVGGHDFSNQTFDGRHRAVVHLYEHPPSHAGCRTHRIGRGGAVKLCRLQTMHRR